MLHQDQVARCFSGIAEIFGIHLRGKFWGGRTSCGPSHCNNSTTALQCVAQNSADGVGWCFSVILYMAMVIIWNLGVMKLLGGVGGLVVPFFCNNGTTALQYPAQNRARNAHLLEMHNHDIVGWKLKIRGLGELIMLFSKKLT